MKNNNRRGGLNGKLKGRILWAVDNKIQWLNPTISPAPKDYENKEIESLRLGMEYFAPYSNEIILQKKYMGSYCMMYLNVDHSKSYFVTRNGHVINYVDGLHEASKDLHAKIFDKVNDLIEWVLVESELMPWSTLGKGLIEYEYGNYGVMQRRHHDNLIESNIMDKVDQILTKYESILESGTELLPHEKRQYESAKNFPQPSRRSSIDLYDKQYQIFGQDGPIEFKPFNILKVIDTFGSNHDVKFTDRFFYMDPGDYLIVENDDYESAYKFLENHKADNAEGIMIKPSEQGILGIAPALKVRTNDYLQLIYGVNFDRDYDYYLGKRNIKMKLRQSVSDYENSYRLAEINRRDISEDNRYYMDLLCELIAGEEYSKAFDTRL